MTIRKQNYGTSGFTLIEFLLGVMIFSIIALSIYGTFSGGINLTRRSDGQNEIYREARWTFEWMAKDLENAVYYDFSKSYPDQAAFVGAEDKISFILPAEDGLRVVSYYLVLPDEGQVFKTVVGSVQKKNTAILSNYREGSSVYYLVREERNFIDFLAGNPEEPDESETLEIIATNVAEDGLRFSYGYAEGEEEKVFSWQEEWSLTYVPSGVRVEIDFLPKNEKANTLTLNRDVLIPSGYWGESGSES